MKMRTPAACLPELSLSEIAAWAAQAGHEALEVAAWPSVEGREWTTP